METVRVNEETVDGNYVIELFDFKTKEWKYIATEFSATVSVTIMINLHNATGDKCRVLSRRSNNMLLSEV